MQWRGGSRTLVLEGGLFSYGPDLRENFRWGATYIDSILKGARPGDLPVYQPSRIELVLNLKTAKALGLAIPPAILLRADEVVSVAQAHFAVRACSSNWTRRGQPPAFGLEASRHRLRRSMAPG